MASQGEPSTQQRNANGQYIHARDNDGKFTSLGHDQNAASLGGAAYANATDKNVLNTPNIDESSKIKDEIASIKENFKTNGDMSNMLRHIEKLERKLADKDTELNDAKQRVEKFSARTREGMQSALDSLMKKWMDAVETKDDRCKEEFKRGMEKLVQNSAEENGVWQMMVAASALHERREHDLEQLRMENNELKEKIDGHYASSDSRTRSTGKRKAEEEGDRVTTAASETNIWDDFAKDVGMF